MIHNRFEVTLLEPLIEIEALSLVMATQNNKWDLNITSSGRILTIEGPKTIKPVIKWLAAMGLGPDVGLIRRITEYEPDEYEKEFVEVIYPDDEL